MGKLALTISPPSPCSSCDSSVVPPSYCRGGSGWPSLPAFIPFSCPVFNCRRKAWHRKQDSLGFTGLN